MADESKAIRIVQAYDDGKRLRANCDSRVDLLAPYIDPTRYGVLSRAEAVEGLSLMANVYDSTGIFAADLAANYVMTHIANPASKWFNLVERRSELNDQDEVREWMEECRDRMLKDRGQSNFYSEAHQVVKDWLGFGTGNMILEERPVLPYERKYGYQGTRWTCYKIGRFVIFENGWHMVDQTYIDFLLTAQAAASRFGLENLSDKIQNTYSQNDRQSKFKFIHAVYPRSMNGTPERKYGNKAMSFASCYVEYDSKNVVKESGYRENPYVSPRYHRVPGEVYGRGRGELALNDMLTLNTAKRLELEELALVIRPPYWVASDSVFGTINLQPGSQNTIRSTGRSLKDLIMMHESSARFDVAQIKEEELRKSIMETFYVQQIRELMMLENRPGEMTLGEYARRLNLLHKIAGAVYPMLEVEWLKPDVERQFSLMYEAGEFPPPPDALLEQGGEIDVNFENPLARAQRMEEVDAMDRMLSRLGPIAELQVKFGGKSHAEILDNFPFDKWAQKIAEIEGVPATLVNSERQVAVIRGSRAEAEQEQQAGMEAMAVTEGLKNVTPMLKALQEQRRAA